MDYKELVEKLEEIYDGNVSSFAYNESCNFPDDFKFSEETSQLEKKRNNAYKLYTAHPGTKDATLRDAEYERLYKEFTSIPWHYTAKFNEYLESIGIGKMNEVEQHGGENEGSNWYSVKHFPKHNIYIKVSGWYQSHVGTDFYTSFKDSCQEVTPKQVTVTQYL